MHNPKNAYLTCPLVSRPPAFFTPKGGRAEQKKIDGVDRKLKQFPRGDAETPQAIKTVLNARLNEAEIEHEMNVFLDGLKR